MKPSDSAHEQAHDAEILSLGEAHYHFLSQWPGFVRENFAGAALIGNRQIAMPFRNHVALVRSTPADAPHLIARATDFYQELKVLPAFQLDRATRPPELPDLLLSSGYVKQTEEVWMTCAVSDTAGDAPAAPAASPLTIEQITTASPEAWIDAYIRCFNTNFGVPEHSQSGFGASFRGVLSNPNALHFVGFAQGEAAGALSLFHNGSFTKNKVGGIYNVGTFPAFRGRGIATALLHHLIDVARPLGLTHLILQTRHRGPAQPIYERVGFRVRFVRDWYLPEAPKGIWSE